MLSILRASVARRMRDTTSEIGGSKIIPYPAYNEQRGVERARERAGIGGRWYDLSPQTL